MKKKPYYVVIGDSLKEEGKTFFRYTVMGPAGEVMRGVREGKKTEVQKYAKKFADKLNAAAPSQRFIINQQQAA